ncbi:hypothetical protein GCM10009097_55910 [Pigmentiphaga daeguensis]|uniref:HNH endonuclease n=1 Tax=Pigmentiphaga daeguensis TaxID=414049 RepID=A0ABN1D1P1_9BURK
MNAPINANMDRTKYLGGKQSKRVPLLNEGLVRHLYGSGMTIAELAVEIGCTDRALRLFMIRCGIERRVAAKRDQRGPNNCLWKADRVTYKAAHNRVYATRGRPQKCEHCGSQSTDRKYEWANVSGKYHDPSDYIRLCRSCHCKYDGLLKNLGDYANVPPKNRP